MVGRKPIPKAIQLAVLTEAGWRCAVPTCRTILALDLHHLDKISEGGKNDAVNLLPLCPTCHALHHRGDLTRDALYTYKAMLVALSQAFDIATIDQLLFLDVVCDRPLQPQGQGVLSFMRLISARLADFENTGRDMGVEFYSVALTERGKALVDAWKSGNRERLETVLRGTV